MKKLAFTIVLVLSQIILLAQCPENLFLSTQEQIDNFQTDYPGCTEIEGSLTIAGEDITNLDGLAVLTSIGYLFDIYNNSALTSLSGLDNLTFVGNSVLIYANPLLIDLSGLDNLESIGEEGLRIKQNHSLTSLTGLEKLTTIGGNLRIENNGSLNNLTGLDNVSSIDGYLWIYDSPYLSSLTGLSSLTSSGGININGSNSLSNLEGLENLVSIEKNLVIGDKIIYPNNPLLTSLSGLNSLVSVGGKLEIGNNDTLISLDGLDNLISIGGDLKIIKNYYLSNIEGLASLSTITPWGNLSIQSNKSLKSLKGLDKLNAESIYNLVIAGNDSLLQCETKTICNYLANPNGSVSVNNNASGCMTTAQIEKACEALSVNELSFSSHLSIYPNPFTTTTTIQYQLQQPETVQISIFNHLGKQVHFIQEEQSAGKQQVLWEATGLPSGMYYYNIQIGSETTKGKMVVAR